MSKVLFYIGYELHKDKSRTLIECNSIEQKEIELSNLKKDNYKPVVILTKEKADNYLNNCPATLRHASRKRPLTQLERYNNWAVTGQMYPNGQFI